MKAKNLFLFILILSMCSLRATEDKNAFFVTDNGLEMFRWDLKLIQEAQESVEISAVYLGGDIAQQLLQTLEVRLSQVPNLQVFILIAPILLEKEDYALIDHLLACYPDNFHIQYTSSIAIATPDVAGIDNHQKMCIIDEKYFSGGGTNLDDALCTDGTWTPPRKANKLPAVSGNLPAGARDQDLLGRGPIARQMRHYFHQCFSLWEHYNRTGIFERNPARFADKSHYFPVNNPLTAEQFDQLNLRVVDTEETQVIFCGPQQKINEITTTYAELIDGAQEEIIIANLYFAPADPIFEALIRATNRGVKIRVLSNGISDIAPDYTKYFSWANRIHYVPLLYGKTFHFWDAKKVAQMPEKDCVFYEYNVSDILLHKKMMVIDGIQSVVGSYNLGCRSHIGDYEMVFVIRSQEIAADLKKVFARDLEYSLKVSAASARSWYFDPVKSALGNLQKSFHGLM